MKGIWKEARKIVRIARQDGYTGPFVVLRETMMEEMQATYGRVLAENKNYIKAFDTLLAGDRICEYCEDCEECANHDKWLEGRCPDFMLRFPDEDESKQAFAEFYEECDERVHSDEERRD